MKSKFFYALTGAASFFGGSYYFNKQKAFAEGKVKLMNQKKMNELFKPLYPSDYVHGLLSLHTYQEDIQKASQADAVHFNDDSADIKKTEKYKKYNSNLENWQIYEVIYDKNSGFCSVIYYNEEHKQVVLAYRGTTFEFGDLFRKGGSVRTDIDGILNGQIVPQQSQTSAATKIAVDFANRNEFQLSITGHSLGAWLAEQSLYFCNFDCNTKPLYVKAVTFDSPGSANTLRNTFNSNQGAIEQERQKQVSDLDIVTYLSVPNIVNICNGHEGTKLYRIYPDLSQNTFDAFLKFISKYKHLPIIGDKIKANQFILHSIASISSHSLELMLDQFDPQNGKPKKYSRIESWPKINVESSNENGVSAWINSGFEWGVGQIWPNKKTEAQLAKIAATKAQELNIASVLSVLYDVWTGNISADKFAELKQLLDESCDKTSFSKSSNDIEMTAADKFKIKYEMKYSVKELDLRSAELNSDKCIADFYLEEIKKFNFGNYGIHDDFSAKLEYLKNYYEVHDASRRVTVKGELDITIEELRDTVMSLLREYPEKKKYLDYKIANFSSLLSTSSTENRSSEKPDYLVKKEARMEEIRKLNNDKKSIDEIKQHFINMPPDQKCKFFVEETKSSNEEQVQSYQDKIKSMLEQGGEALKKFFIQKINDDVMVDIIEVLIEEGNKQISNYTTNSSKEHVIVVGDTGVGKSTVVNYVTDAKLRVKTIKKQSGSSMESKTVIDLDPSDKHFDKRPMIGHDSDSATIIPNCYEDPNSNKVYWDCPGFKDTRGPEQEIVNSFYIKRLFDSFDKVKIVFVVSKSQLDSNRYNDFRSFIERVTKLFGDDAHKLKGSAFVVTQVDDLKIDYVEKCKSALNSLQQSKYVSDEDKKTLKALLDKKCTFGVFPSYQELSVRSGSIVDNNHKTKIIQGVDSALTIKGIKPKMPVGDKEENYVTKLFRDFENVASQDVKEAVKLLDAELKDKDLHKTLSLISFLDSKAPKNGNFFQQFRKKLKDLEIDYSNFQHLENMFKTLEFLREINTDNKVNYDLLNFQNLENTKKDVLNKVKQINQERITQLQMNFVIHLKKDIKEICENKTTTKDVNKIKELGSLLSFLEKFGGRTFLGSKLHPVLDGYDEIKEIYKIIKACEDDHFLKMENVHGHLADSAKNTLYDQMSIIVENALAELGQDEASIRDKLIMKKESHEAMNSFIYLHHKTTGELSNNCTGKNSQNIFTGGVIKLSEVRKVLASGECPFHKEVFLLSWDKVDFDASLDLSRYGNVAISGPTWLLNEPVSLVLSGRALPDQPKAAKGNSKNKNGNHGMPGNPGNPGKHFMGVVDNIEGDLSSLTINVQGSNGQNGQEGGDGKDGDRGWFSEGDLDGGNGGDGGIGGDPGKPGNIKIYQGYEKAKLLAGYNLAPDSSVKGADGAGGKGGIYGEYTEWWSKKTSLGKNGTDGKFAANTKGKKAATSHVPMIKKSDVQTPYCSQIKQTNHERLEEEKYLKATMEFLYGPFYDLNSEQQNISGEVSNTLNE